MRYPPVPVRSVLITGCSSGIGLATARHLRDRGWTVLPTARKPADLEMLQGEGFHPVELDIGDSASVDRAAEATLAAVDGKLGAIVNNAGFAQGGALEDVSRDALRQQFEVNVFGVQELTNRFIPGFREQGGGRIVNVSSIFGLVTSPLLGSYCASKYALESLSDALRIELRSAGIAVSLIEPGPIITEFRKNAAAVAAESLDLEAATYKELYTKEIEKRKRKKKPRQPDLFTRPPEDVALKIERALVSSRPRSRYPVTIPAHFGAWMKRLAPTALLDYLLVKRIEKR